MGEQFNAPVKSDLPDIHIVQLPGQIQPGWEAPRGAVRRPGPSRLALYHQNWSGESTWQTWCNLDFPVDTRSTIMNQAAQAGALTTLARNQAAPTAVRPIPLQDYTLQTRMTYVGTIGADGRIYRG